MLPTHAVGIDLGTTYSSIAYLNEHGEPVTLANQEGELSTPSVVMFEDDELIVGTEALRNAIVRPEHVVQNSKRFLGDPSQRWTIDGKPYTPVDISTFILKKLISAAQEQIGVIEQAVITVPAQFSDAQRHATIEAGHRAGLQRVDLINEPVAAALCHVLGSEGLWFTELADEQRILVYDLGGGTFDLSLVSYRKNEVRVIASSGDLHLGGIDWNETLLNAIAEQFKREFGSDPRGDRSSLQALTIEAEQTKRSLTVRPRAAFTCQHDGARKTYQIEQAQFEKLTRPLVDRTAEITKRLLKDNKFGWAHVDVVLTTGGSSRMPMIRDTLKQMSGRTLNTSLSPDLSIAHGATYYAGMLLTDSKFARSVLNEKAYARLSQIKQRSVNARALGILVRDTRSNGRVPHYLIPANTPLPTSVTQTFGTVIPNQRRVSLQIVESGTSPEQPFARLGACVIDDLPRDLPEDSEIAVTIRYDAEARVHVSAKDVASGKEATTEILRAQNLAPQLAEQGKEEEASMLTPETPPPNKPTKPSSGASASKATAAPIQPPARKPQSVGPKRPEIRPAPKPRPVPPPAALGSATTGLPLDAADRPIPLCNECGNPLDARGECRRCGPAIPKAGAKGAARPQAPPSIPTQKNASAAGRRGSTRRAAAPGDEDELFEFNESGSAARSRPARQPAPGKKPLVPGEQRRREARKPQSTDEDEFWQLAE